MQSIRRGISTALTPFNPKLVLTAAMAASPVTLAATGAVTGAVSGIKSISSALGSGLTKTSEIISSSITKTTKAVENLGKKLDAMLKFDKKQDDRSRRSGFLQRIMGIESGREKDPDDDGGDDKDPKREGFFKRLFGKMKSGGSSFLGKISSFAGTVKKFLPGLLKWGLASLGAILAFYAGKQLFKALPEKTQKEIKEWITKTAKTVWEGEDGQGGIKSYISKIYNFIANSLVDFFNTKVFTTDTDKILNSITYKHVALGVAGALAFPGLAAKGAIIGLLGFVAGSAIKSVITFFAGQDTTKSVETALGGGFTSALVLGLPTLAFARFGGKAVLTRALMFVGSNPIAALAILLVTGAFAAAAFYANKKAKERANMDEIDKMAELNLRVEAEGGTKPFRKMLQDRISGNKESLAKLSARDRKGWRGRNIIKQIQRDEADLEKLGKIETADFATSMLMKGYDTIQGMDSFGLGIDADSLRQKNLEDLQRKRLKDMNSKDVQTGRGLSRIGYIASGPGKGLTMLEYNELLRLRGPNIQKRIDTENDRNRRAMFQDDYNFALDPRLSNIMNFMDGGSHSTANSAVINATPTVSNPWIEAMVVRGSLNYMQGPWGMR